MVLPVNQTDSNDGTYPMGTVARDRCLTGYWPANLTLERVCADTELWMGDVLYCELIRCGVPPNSAYANKSWTDDRYGSEVNYTCHEGTRHVSGDLVRTCLGTRVWSGKTPFCQVIFCESPPEVAHTTALVSSFRFGASVSYSCEEGYRSDSGDVIKTCLGDGTWIPDGENITCQEITCSAPPPEVSHAQIINVTGHVMGSRAFYKCDLGYRRVSGEMTSVCQESASWSDVSLVCSAISCNRPPEISNTVTQFSDARYQATASYRCSQGYHYVTGSQDIECQVDGTWTNAGIQCERTRCPDPSPWLSAHSRIVAMTGLGVGETLEVGCAEGYKYIAGSQVWTCLVDGSWQTDDVICQEVLCGTPEEGAGVACQPTEGRVGQTLTCHCQESYRLLEGDSQRTCLFNGQWTGGALKCQELVCANITSDIIDPNMTFDLEGVKIGSRMFLTCRHGYVINGSDELTCTPDGAWPAEIPSCGIVDCGPPPSVNHTSLSYNGTAVFSQAVYDCLLTFEPSDGDRYVTCNPEGLWEGTPLTCTPMKCDLPKVLPGSELDFREQLVVGSTATYTCDPGLILTAGDDVRQCQLSGNWSGAAPTCEAIRCPDPPAIVNATWRIDRYASVHTARYKCFPDHIQLSGDLQITCGGNGTWIISGPPVCVADPDEPDSFLPVEVLTPTERYYKSIGFTKSDLLEDHVATGALGVVMLLFAVGMVIAADIPPFRREIKHRLLYNIKSLWRHYRVGPVV